MDEFREENDFEPIIPDEDDIGFEGEMTITVDGNEKRVEYDLVTAEVGEGQQVDGQQFRVGYATDKDGKRCPMFVICTDEGTIRSQSIFVFRPDRSGLEEGRLIHEETRKIAVEEY